MNENAVAVGGGGDEHGNLAIRENNEEIHSEYNVLGKGEATGSKPTQWPSEG